MRKQAILLSLVLCATVSFGSLAWAAVPAKSQNRLQIESAKSLPGRQAELESALKEPSAIAYKLLVIDDNPADRTAYLDEVLAKWGWPAANEMLLVVFPKANYDIRFALGANFRLNHVSVEEMLGLVRSEYFTRSQHGDVYGGLAGLVRAVNRRLSPAGMNTDQARFEATRQAVALIANHDAEGLLAMAQPGGLHLAPYAVGLPDEGMSTEKALKALSALVHEATPEIVGYDLQNDGKFAVAVKGLEAGLEVPSTGSEDSRVTTTELALLTLRLYGSEWKLSSIAFDRSGLLVERIEKGQYQKPFAWFQVKEGGESYSTGYGSEPGGQTNTTQQKVTQSVAEAVTYLGQGVHLPAWLEGKPMVIHRGFTTDYAPLNASLMTTDPSFHASYSPVGKHTGYIEPSSSYRVSYEHRTLNGRPALIIMADEQREGGWKHRYLLIEDGNWLYVLEDGTGNLERLLELAAAIPPGAD